MPQSEDKFITTMPTPPSSDPQPSPVIEYRDPSTRSKPRHLHIWLISILAVVLSIILGLFILSGGAGTGQGTLQINVHVRDAITKQPIPSATVVLDKGKFARVPLADPPRATDSRGDLSFASTFQASHHWRGFPDAQITRTITFVTAASYIDCSAPGYAPNSVRILNPSFTKVLFFERSHRVDIDITLVPTPTTSPTSKR